MGVRKTAETRENHATKWDAISEKLMTFKRPTDPLQPFLESMFTKVVAVQFYTGGANSETCAS